MRLVERVKLCGPGIPQFAKPLHSRVASTGPGAALLLFFATFSPAAHADQATLEVLLADPAASISVGSLKFDHFSLDRFQQGPLPSDVTVSGILLNGESGLQFTGAYGPGSLIFDLMTFDVTIADPSALLHDATLAFDAPQILNPDDLGRASAESLIFRQPFFPLFDIVGHLLVCTEGPQNPGLCSGQNTFVDHTPFMELGGPGPVDLPSAHVQLEISVNENPFAFDPATTNASIGQVDITFSQVPEPATLVLLITGLTALAWKRKVWGA
jgi:hypothetical protein